MHSKERDLVTPAAALTSAMIGQMKMKATPQEAAALYFSVLRALADESARPVAEPAPAVKLY